MDFPSIGILATPFIFVPFSPFLALELGPLAYSRRSALPPLGHSSLSARPIGLNRLIEQGVRGAKIKGGGGGRYRTL